MKRALPFAAALLAGCQQAPSAADQANANVVGARDPAPLSSPTPGTASGTLARYVGKYPDDAVDGRSFLQEPLVRSGVEEVVTDAALRKMVLTPATSVPIVERNGQLVAAACEPHNCGEHNWAIVIRADGSRPLVCHKPEGGAPEWYGPTPVGAAKDGCLPNT